MLKRLPSRNQRSKGVKVKHVLQICLLLGVCFWLIYQVKHSHDKRKEFDENDAKISAKEQVGDQILKLGRKDLHPHVEEITTKNENHEEEEEDEETVGEVEENKPEDELQEEDKNKHEEVEQEEEENQTEETEDVGGGAGDDEIDEQGQEKPEGERDEQGHEKPEGEVDREEGFMDEEKERENEGDDKESEGNEGEESEELLENENSTEDQDHDGGGRNTHEAREEHYKADDASSAVAHDIHTLSSETEKQSSEDSNANLGINLSDNKFSNTTEIGGDKLLKVGEGQIFDNGTSLDAKASEDEIRSAELNEQVNASNNSMRVSIETSNNSSGAIETSGYSQQNVKETLLDSTEVQNGTVTATGEEVSNPQTHELDQPNNSNTADQSNSTLTVAVNTKNENVPMGENKSLNSSSHSDTASEHTDGNQNERSENKIENESGESDETLGTSFTNEIADPLDSSITQNEETRIDLDTLPDIRTEGDNSEDVAEE